MVAVDVVMEEESGDGVYSNSKPSDDKGQVVILFFFFSLLGPVLCHAPADFVRYCQTKQRCLRIFT